LAQISVPPQVLRLEPEQLPALGDHEVLVNVLAVGAFFP
jgi:NADPH:quinone reductase-like Zn-dependent oxidoreductase